MPSIEKQAARGAVWTIGAGLIARVLGVCSTLLLAKYITPTEYDPVICAFVIVVTTIMIGSFGLSPFLVVQKDITDEEKFHVCFFHLAGTGASLLILYAYRVEILGMLDCPEAIKFIPYFCVSGALDRLLILPERMMSRQLKFRQIALCRAGCEIVYASTALTLGILGWKGMSIAFANIVQYGLLTCLLFCFVRFGDLMKPCRLSLDVIKRIFYFGAPLAINDISHYAARQWDRPMMKFFGDGKLSIYNMAYNLADIPASHIGEHIGDVLLPSFAKMDAVQGRWALQRATGFLAIIVFPMAIGLAVVSPTLTTVLLDPEWADVAPMLTLLAALSVVRPIGWTMGSYLQSMSETRVLMVLSLVRLAILMGTLYALRPFGAIVACSAAGFAYAAHAAGAMYMVSRKGGVSVGQILIQLWPPLAASIPMVLLVLGVRYILSASWQPSILTLSLEILAGALAYVLAMRVISPALFDSVVQQVKELVLRKKTPAYEGDDS